VKKPIPFGNKYLLLERVNVGGMAEVFKAKAFGVEGFERLVAVKRILPSIAEDEEFITMFIDEAKIAVQLTHANVAQIFDLGKVADSYFIAMEFVRGKDLRAIFDRVRKRGGTVPVPMACYSIMKVCEGLDYAHNKKDSAGRDLNLVHRDVSPQNVLLSYDGEIKLIDFGIAKAANKAGKTQAGILKGKFGYMSPEQVRGLPLDRRSDVFSVGIVLYELLTGERLFVGESDFSTLEKVRNVEIMPPSTYNRKIPEELEQIVLKALAKDVDDRYQTAMDLHDDLQSFMYTSGNFFARKDLAAYMGKAFAEEITREEARDEQYRKIRAPGDSGLDAFDDLPRRSEPAAKKKPPAPPAAANVSKAPPPPPPRPKPQKRTMMGMGAVAPPPPRPSAPQPPPPRPSAPQPPPAQPQPSGPTLDMDWDDDELATQIYDKPEGEDFYPGPGQPQSQPSHAPMLSAPTAAPRSSSGAPSPFGAPTAGPGAAPPSSRPGLPSPFDEGPAGPGPTSQPPVREPTEVTRQPKSEKSGSMGMLIGIGVVVLLALAAGAWYMLRPPEPGTVHLTTDPADPTVLFDDQQVQATSSPFVLANVEPGAHLIEVRKTGYQTWSTQIDLRPGQTLTLPPVTLRPDEGAPAAAEGTGFALTSAPAGAKVFVDGRELDGTTPLRVEDLPAGSHTVRVEAEGRRAWQRQIQLDAGQMMELEAELEGATVSVRFESSPRGAEVVLVRGDEREEIGTTPVREDVDLSGGGWTIEMSRSGYETWTDELEVPDGEERFTVEAELDREARVAVNTMRRRTTRMTGGGGGSGGGGPTMTAAASGPGTLRVNTRPWSQVYVDGRLIGNTPQMNITVPAGSHRLTLVNPDFNIRHNVTVNVPAGQTVTKVITLPTN